MTTEPALNSGRGRTAIMDAVLRQFQGVAPWVTISRKFRMWDAVKVFERPALFLLFNGEERTHGDGESHPPKIIMEVTAFVYITSPPGTPVPSTQLETLLDKFDQALAPSPLMGSKQTLGGLVSHCWIEGKTLLVPGDIESDGLAIIPLRILIPS